LHIRMARARAVTVGIASIALAASGLAFAGAASASAASMSKPAAASPGWVRACANAHSTTIATCMALINTRVAHMSASAVRPDAAPTNDGFGPSQLQSAYKLPSSTDGAGVTVAVIDAFNDPDAASNLATYRSDFGQPACNTSTEEGCVTVLSQTGSTTSLPKNNKSSGWGTEESLDIDMVSAICPLCHIDAVEATSASIANLGAAVNEAVKLGAVAISNSYGASESSSETGDDTSFYEHSGVAVTASAGDGGFGVSYPAASQFVTSVGGTSLSTSSNSRGWTEKVWSTSSTEGTGAGCSADEAQPSWQTALGLSGCSKRIDNDVAAVADPNTGVAVFDTFDQNGFLEVGGTSASSPIIASVFALADNLTSGVFPSSLTYKTTGDLFDVTTGSLGSCSPAFLCTAEVGFDGPTGNGTPDGIGDF
jgi:subtilase family serine protease